MAKETRKQQYEGELAALANGLTNEQLIVIRKLNGATFISGQTNEAATLNSTHSKRTIEAILQGRRHDAKVLRAAIYGAKKNLEHQIRIMSELEKLLCSNVTTPSIK